MEIRIKFYKMNEKEMKDVLLLLKKLKYPSSYPSNISELTSNIKDVELLATLSDLEGFIKQEDEE